jgi:hypothetical protein
MRLLIPQGMVAAATTGWRPCSRTRSASAEYEEEVGKWVVWAVEVLRVSRRGSWDGDSVGGLSTTRLDRTSTFISCARGARAAAAPSRSQRSCLETRHFGTFDLPTLVTEQLGSV